MRTPVIFALSAVLALVGQAAWVPAATLQEPHDEFIIRYVQQKAAVILSAADPSVEPYKVMFSQDLIHTRDVNITDAANKPVATMAGKIALNPFDYDYDIEIADGSGAMIKGQLDRDIFFIWNTFDIELPGVNYKVMCGLATTTCNVVATRPNQPDQVKAVITFAKQMMDYTLLIAKDIPVGVGLLAGVLTAHGWTQKNIQTQRVR
jgi:hypothetical protein